MQRVEINWSTGEMACRPTCSERQVEARDARLYLPRYLNCSAQELRRLPGVRSSPTKCRTIYTDQAPSVKVDRSANGISNGSPLRHCRFHQKRSWCSNAKALNSQHHVARTFGTDSKRYLQGQTQRHELGLYPTSSTANPDRKIRESLRKWKPPAEHVLPVEPHDPQMNTLYSSQVCNNLTRPDTEELGGGNLHDLDDQVREHLQDFNRITDVSDGASVAATMLKRGDLVELRRMQAVPALAIFLRITENDYFQYYTIGGKLVTTTYRTGSFQVNGFASLEEIEPIMPFVPRVTDEIDLDAGVAIPRNLSAPVLRKMVRFRTECEAIRRRYTAELENAFELLAHPTEIRHMALEDIVAAITKIPVNERDPYPEELVWTISNSLMNDQFGFTLDVRTFASTRIITIQPKENTIILRRVQRYVRAFQEEAAAMAGGVEVNSAVASNAAHLKAFARKCQKLIAESRQFRRYSPEGTVISCNKGAEIPPDLAGVDTIHSIEFSDIDRDFIRVLKLHTLTNALHRHPSYVSLAPSIVRAIQPVTSDNQYRESEVWNLLIEIGAIDPFAQAQGFDTEVWPPNAKLTRDLRRVESKLEEGVSLTEIAQLRDSMADFRTDWGDLPVFAVDSATTEEVDDGISLEEIPDEPGHYWLRVHVAHISAFTSPSDIIGRCAELRVTSLYLDMCAYKMLPRWATEQFSIAQGTTCLTYSAKVDSEGEMLDLKVEPGILRNVIYTTPELVDEAFQSSSLHLGENFFTLRCSNNTGAEPEPAEATRALTVPTAEHLKTLRKLHEILEKIRKKRVKSTLVSHSSREVVNCNVRGIKGEVNVDTYTNPTHARFCLKDPTITFNVNQEFDKLLLKDSVLTPSSVIVEQSMLLAGVVGAKWAHARNIPIIYSGTRPAVDGLDDITALSRINLLESAWNRKIVSKILSLYAIRHLTSYPHEQRIMGVAEYAKVTSPLRRFMDLVSSWQIDAALREEHRTGVSLVGRPDVPAPFLHYQRSGVELVIRLMLSRLQDIQWWSNNNRTHWEIQAVARAFYLGEGTLPNPLTCTIGEVQRGVCLGIIRELEFRVQVEFAEGEVTPERDEVWEVVIKSVNTYFRVIVVEPVRKIE